MICLHEAVTLYVKFEDCWTSEISGIIINMQDILHFIELNYYEKVINYLLRNGQGPFSTSKLYFKN